MLHRGTAVRLACLIVAGIGLAAVPLLAQETQKAPGDGTPALTPAKSENTAGGTGSAGEPEPETGKQPTTQGAAGKGPGRQQQPSSFFGQWGFMIVLFGGMMLLLFWSSRSRKKQEAKRKEMIAALKKGDKIVTIGGIVGTIIEARPEEVTVKVDETNNVRMKFARWAIRGAAEDAKKEPEPSR